jgi:hypothetical protein
LFFNEKSFKKGVIIMDLSRLMENWADFLVPFVFFILFVAMTRISYFKKIKDYQLVYKYRVWSKVAEIEVLENRNGWTTSGSLFTFIHTIDLRPMKVSENLKKDARHKTVKFNPAGLKEFLLKYGKNSYEYAGGQHLSPLHRGGMSFDEILALHAFDGQEHSFLTVLS